MIVCKGQLPKCNWVNTHKTIIPHQGQGHLIDSQVTNEKESKQNYIIDTYPTKGKVIWLTNEQKSKQNYIIGTEHSNNNSFQHMQISK